MHKFFVEFELYSSRYTDSAEVIVQWIHMFNSDAYQEHYIVYTFKSQAHKHVAKLHIKHVVKPQVLCFSSIKKKMLRYTYTFAVLCGYKNWYENLKLQ